MPKLRIEDRDRGSWTVFDDEAGPPPGAGPRVVLVAGGSAPDESRLRQIATGADVLVCTDGGLRAAWAVGLVPALVVGDPKALPDWARERLPAEAVVDDRGQDQNDLEKALSEIRQRWGDGAEVSVLGAASGGERTDHTLAHLGALLVEPHRRLQWIDRGGRMVALRSGKLFVEDAVGATLSLLPWSLHGTVLSGVGVHYPLDEERLQLGGRGIANQVGDDEASVEVHEGVVLIWIGV
jgi:thiamine pyrophosphokinase